MYIQNWIEDIFYQIYFIKCGEKMSIFHKCISKSLDIILLHEMK